MKPITYSIIAALGLAGSAFAAEAFTTPVGYVTENIASGFNFVGLTVHEPTIAAGTIDAVTTNAVTDNNIDFDTVLTTGQSYVLEINNGTGIIQITGSWSGSDLDVAADLTTDVSIGDSYALRPAHTLASAFGVDGGDLTKGSFGEVGADQIWIFNGTGYDKYYYDTFSPIGFGSNWVQFEPVSQDIADPSSVVIDYSEGFLIFSSTAKGLTFTGEVKTTGTELNLTSGFNFASSVAPVGATLESAFGADGGDLVKGSFGEVGADQIWLFNGTGYDKYYYDTFSPIGFGSNWVQFEPVSQDVADPSSVDVDSGYLIFSTTGGNVFQGVPSYYDDL